MTYPGRKQTLRKYRLSALSCKASGLCNAKLGLDILDSILSGLGVPSTLLHHLSATNTLKSPPYTTTPKENDIAAHILNQLFTSEKSPSALNLQIQSHFRTTNWTESLAHRILDGIVSALESGKVLVGTMKETYDKVREVAEEYVRDHPVLMEVLIMVVAIGILAVLVPWAVEALGFGELGVEAGSFAAWWQSTFPGVEAGSLFSYLQRLGMKWGKA